MTPKQYLRQAAMIKRQIERTNEQIEEITTLMQNVRAIQYDKINIQSSPSGDQLINDFIRLDTAKERFIQQQADYYTIYHTIETQINQIENELFRDILVKVYLKEMPLCDVAKSIYKSEKYIQNKHGEALQEFGHRFLGC